MATFTFKNTNITTHHSWDNFFNDPTIQGYLTTIESQIGNTYTPDKNDIFKVFQKNLVDCKVVILGQDPYPQVNATTGQLVATGRAFEENGITSWDDAKQTTVQNIVKLLHNNAINSPVTPVNIARIKQVRQDINHRPNPIFNIVTPNHLFVNWENQGVLLLNTALTCPQGDTSQSNGHAEYWHDFIKKLIIFIDTSTPELIWFLWGRNSKNLCCLISNGTKYCSTHPRNSSTDIGSFYHENHFSKVGSITWA